ncbi:DUF1178 family protein [Stakelama sp. CBK3Z-3]|uniref:DUF1178 family protein n=1 Tax=Stakelama flava TaxID=2860338 RepID=A0ABS6XHB1_9SPHN|nr:DUF1178 family protein [Stakelama flava]MBW4329604.1 DUF1178 family protein [Stakelama flava]
MIVFDLKCGAGHVFESWFASSSAYAEQKADGLIRCPICGDASVEKALMAPNIATKGNRRELTAAQPPAEKGEAMPEAVKQAMAALAQAQQKALEGSQWVGSAFTERARAMHHGEEDRAAIHGEATIEQARELLDDGIAVAPLPFPVVPPSARN